MKEAEDLRLKYEASPKDMPGDEIERWEKAVADADLLRKQIEVANKQDEQAKWGDKINKGLEAIAGGNLPDESKGGPPSDGEKAMAKFILKGLKGLDEAEFKALSVGSNVDGGFLTMPTMMANRFIDLVKDQVFIRRNATVLPLEGQAQSISASALDTDGEDFDWTSEVSSGNEDDTMKFGRRLLTPTAVAKRIKSSRYLLQLDKNGGIQFVLDRLAYRHAVTEEKAFLTGNGSGQPLGVATESTQGISTGRNESTAASNVIAGDDFWRVHGALKPEYRARARWIIHRNLETRIRLLKDSNNNYIWHPNQGFNGQFLVSGMPQTICGLPYDITEYLTDPADSGNITTGTIAAILGDFSYYWIADQMNALEVQRLEELYAESNQVGFIMRKYTDGMPVREEAFSRLKVS